ncbi:MAG TPA: glucokinase [Microbacterium sp.]|nr:glucokinase [Microbacterium sp.]
MLSIGIDIGGTKIAGGVVDESGVITSALRIATPQTPRGIEKAVAAMICELPGETAIPPVGLAAAGFMNRERTIVRFAPNIAWRDEPLRDRIAELAGVDIVLENDADAAGWAEYRFGAGRGRGSVAMITLGTGVGGAIIMDGELSRGGMGIGGELGHVRLIPNGLPCGCGQSGCLEQYASGHALRRVAGEIAEAEASGIGAALAARRGADGEISGATIADLVRADDPGALEALRRVAVPLGEACGSFAAILDPEIFVIGGGVSLLGERLLGPVREAFRSALPAASHRTLAEFAVAELTNDAGVIGVADLARRAYIRDGE